MPVQATKYFAGRKRNGLSICLTWARLFDGPRARRFSKRARRQSTSALAGPSLLPDNDTRREEHHDRPVYLEEPQNPGGVEGSRQARQDRSRLGDPCAFRPCGRRPSTREEEPCADVGAGWPCRHVGGVGYSLAGGGAAHENPETKKREVHVGGEPVGFIIKLENGFTSITPGIPTCSRT